MHDDDEAAARQIAKLLDGSPYSIPDDAAGSAKASAILARCESIFSRQRAAVQQFSEASDEIQARTKRLFETREVYESNALEFSGLPLKETALAIANHPEPLSDLLRHATERSVLEDPHLVEVLGLYEAKQFAEVLSSTFQADGRPLQETDIRDLHRFTLPLARFGGSYKDVEVEISGSDLRTSSVVDVQAHMRELVDWVNRTDGLPALAAAVAHSWLAMIHPFRDGNGRVARLLANLLLLRSGWPPLIIRKSDRLQYLDALTHSDEGGDILPLFDLCVKSISRTAKELADPKLARRLYMADLRENPDKQYQIWVSQVRLVFDGTFRVLESRRWDVNFVDLPTDSAFALLTEGNPSGNTWFAKLKGPDGQDLLVWIGYMSNQMRDYLSGEFAWPSLFISGRDHREFAVHPYRPPWEVSPLQFEEISVLDATSRVSCFVRSGSYVEEHTVESLKAKLLDSLISLEQ